MLRRLEAGEFGNCLRTWLNPWQVDSSYLGLVGIRAKRLGGHGPFCTDMTLGEAIKTWQAWVSTGVRESDLYISEAPPHHLLTIAGEVSEEAGAWTLCYSHRPLPMRQAFREEEAEAISSGVLIADHHFKEGLLLPRLYLQKFLDPPSFRWLDELLWRYPGHVVEFSTFSCDIGVVPRRNTIIWEVRKY